MVSNPVAGLALTSLNPLQQVAATNFSLPGSIGDLFRPPVTATVGRTGTGGLTSIIMLARLRNATELPKLAEGAKNSKKGYSIVWMDAIESIALRDMSQQINLDLARKDSKL